MWKVETDLKQITNPYQSQCFYIKDLPHANTKQYFSMISNLSTSINYEMH
jgi:hypothetical protein